MVSIRSGRTRHIRRRKFLGLSRGAEGAIKNSPRLRRLEAWLTDRETDLVGTVTLFAGFTVNAGSDQVTSTAHGLVSGDGPFTVASSSVLPAGLLAGELYWINRIDDDDFTMHFSKKDAVNGTTIVDITDTGTGTHDMAAATTPEGFIEWMRTGRNPQELDAATDIDNIIP